MTGYIIGAVVLLLVLVVLASALRKRKSSGRHELEIESPRERVWDALTDAPSYPVWQASVDEIEEAGEGLWRVRRWDGVEVELRVLETNPPSGLTWRLRESNDSFSETWSVQLEDLGGRTRIRGRRRDEISSPLTRVLATVRGGRDVEFVEFLRSLKARLEQPEADVAEPSPGDPDGR